MFCRKCGEKLQPEDSLCGSCGSAASTLSRATPPAPESTEDLVFGKDPNLSPREQTFINFLVRAWCRITSMFNYTHK